MASKKEKILKIAIVVLSVLLAISLSVLVWMHIRYVRPAQAIISGNTITTGTVEMKPNVKTATITARKTNVLTTSFGSEPIDEDGILKLYRGNNTQSKPFLIENMFPGDEYEQYYRVEVSHRGPVQVNFRINVNPKDVMDNITTQEERDKYILDDVLECEIWVDNGNGYELKYGGGNFDLMREFDGVISCWTPATRGTSHVDYKIVVSLDDEDVENEYQDTKMFGEFIWWVEVEEESTTERDPYDDDDNYRPTPDKETTGPGGPDETTPGSGIEESGTDQPPQEPGELTDLPKTGDDTIMIAFTAVIIVLLIAILLIGRRRKEDGDEA